MAKEGADAEFNSTLDWIYQIKDEIERAKYGKNQTSVKAALEEQTARKTAVLEYDETVQEVLNKMTDEAEKTRLQAAYDALVNISEKKISCLNTMLEITSLEDACTELAVKFDTNAVSMITKDENSDSGVAEQDEQISGFVAPSSQDCVFAARDNWRWISDLVKCSSTHLENAATYQQFFHEVEESEHWMDADLKKLNDKFQTSKQLEGDYDSAKRILEELEELVVSLRQWECKTSFLWEQSVKVVPVHLRVQGIKEPTPARSLVDYETKEISVHEGEDLLLLANDEPKQWTVKNNRGQEACLPALACLIPGPYKGAVDSGARMRLKLLTAWTTALKRVGKKLIMFMLLVFKAEYVDEEIAVMRSIRLLDKRDLLRILDYVEDTLKVHWSESRGFQLLQERVLALRMILNEGGEHPLDDEVATKALVVQVQILEKLMDKYKELWRQWELMKCSVETSQHPELMLIVDRWEQLQFVGKEYFTKFWQMELSTDDDTDGKFGAGAGGVEVGGSRVAGVPGGMGGQNVMNGEGFMIGRGGAGDAGIPGGHVPRGAMNGDSFAMGYSQSVVSEQLVTSEQSMSVQAAGGLGGMGGHRGGPDYMNGQGMVGTSVSIGGSAGMGDGQGLDGMDGQRVGGLAGAGSGDGQYAGMRLNEGVLEEQMIQCESVGLVSSGIDGSVFAATQSLADYGDYGFSSETRTAETEQLDKAVGGEQRRFIIRSVLDPRNEEEISLQDAIMKGIINPDEGNYINPDTDEKIPIPVAMQQGSIKVSFETTKRDKWEKTSIGIITIKTITEKVAQYEFKSVTDTETGESLSREEAVKRGVLDDYHGVYRDRGNKKEMMIADAIERGLVEAQLTGERKEPEVKSSYYAVRAVVDRRQKKIISFKEAVTRGIIDKDNGAFKDTITGEMMYVGDAIMKGFLKARSISEADTHSLDIEPMNKMVVDKTEALRKKLLRPLSVISALKRAAKAKAEK